MSQSPDPDKVTNGDTVNTTTNETSEPPPPTIAVVPDHQDEHVQKGVENVLYSDIGINTLLARLKQSIASAKDYAIFLKKRGSIEEEHANTLRRLAKSHQESIRKVDTRQGSYVRQLEELMRLHDRIADNGIQFALSIHQMHEDLNELSRNIESGRKHWKHEGLMAEKRASDAETAMEKAKAKYDSLAEEYDRARTGDAKGSRRLGLKGVKNAAQVEDDLHKKLQAADSDYQQKVHTAKSMREELIKTGRPQAIKALQELTTECDAGLALQLQKFATFNEKLLLSNGIVVSPLPSADNATAQHSMRDVVLDIDNEKDFQSYVLNHTSKIPPQREIQYTEHPTLRPKQQTPAPQSSAPHSRNVSSAFPQSPPAAQPAPVTQPTQVTFSGPPTFPPKYNNTTSPNQSVSSPPPLGKDQYPINPPYSQNQRQNSPNQINNPPYPTSGSSIRDLPIAGSVPPSTYLNYTNGGPAPAMGQHHSNNNSIPYNAAPSSAPVTAMPLPPLKPVFGVNLEELFRRDATAVPMVVYQCMQAVDLFGLNVEGIYRVNGTKGHVQKLKAMFDHDSSAVDFRNPTSFSHDINSVADLLKLFFRDLPDPLLTQANYPRLIDAARIEDEVVRRDTIHAIVNDLPDAHYATLRALVLHLDRVRQHESSNRMSITALSVCFAPAMLGPGTGPMSAVQDAQLQQRAFATILENTFQIFDED